MVVSPPCTPLFRSCELPIMIKIILSVTATWLCLHGTDELWKSLLLFIFVVFYLWSCMLADASGCLGQVIVSIFREGIYARSWVHASFCPSSGWQKWSRLKMCYCHLGENSGVISLYYLHCLHYAFCLLQWSVACNLILLGDMLDSDPEWIISHRCSWITVYVFWCNAHIR